MNTYNNFLDKQTFENIKTHLMSDHMPWYFNEGVSTTEDGFFQFTFVFLDEQGINCERKMMNLIEPVLSNLKYSQLRAVKANLLTKTNEIIEQGFHTDQPEGTTSILYINNCNGYTKFKNGEKITSEENKLIKFNSQLEHTGTSCTDENRRVVINFNY